MVKFKKYMPFMPFFGMVFMATFPAGLNLYWCTLSSLNYFSFVWINNKKILKYFGIPEYFPGTFLDKNRLVNKI